MEKNYEIYADKEMRLAACNGLLISKWSGLETQILFLAAWGLQAPLRDTAQLLYNFKTFRLTIDFTSSAVSLRADNAPWLIYWNSLRDYVIELSGDRNFVAHTSLVGHGDGAPDEMDWAKVTPMVGPSIYSSFGFDNRREPLGEEEIRQLTDDIDQAIEALIDFHIWLQSIEPMPDIFLAPIVRRRPSRKERRAKDQKPGPIRLPSSKR